MFTILLISILTFTGWLPDRDWIHKSEKAKTKHSEEDGGLKHASYINDMKYTTQEIKLRENDFLSLLLCP